MSLSAPELKELHYNIIDYLTKRSRIMSARRLSVWSDFSAYYNDQYSDYSGENLRDEFLTTILPKVFSYTLTPIQRRKVEIFATHYLFTQTAEGFCEREGTQQLITEGVHYVQLKIEEQYPKVGCVLCPPESFQETRCPNLKISAWASAINSSDIEVANYRLFRGKRLRVRLAKTRNHFHQTGKLPDNMNSAISKKIIGIREKASKLSAMMDSNFLDK